MTTSPSDEAGLSIKAEHNEGNLHISMKTPIHLWQFLRRRRHEGSLLSVLVPVLSISVLLAGGHEWDTRVDVVLTSENIREYFQHLIERQVEAVLLADMKPAIIYPDSNIIWFNGDNLCIEWQGYAAGGSSSAEFLIEDRTSYQLVIPAWYVLIELYKGNTLVESIYAGPRSYLPEAPFQLNTYYPQYQFKGAQPSRVNLQFEIGAFQPGDDYRLRFVFDQSNREERIHTEVWSSIFAIANPWLEITEPNAITTWFQDSLDIHIAFKNHGSFGMEDPGKLDPRIYLYRDGLPIDTLTSRSYDFTDQVLTVSEWHPDLLTVLTEWGTGDDFQICLSTCGIQSFSDFFSIIGQTIDVILPTDTTTWSHRDDPPFEIRWIPTIGDSIKISLYQIVDIEYLTHIPILEQIAVLATNIGDSGCFSALLQISESGWDIANYRIKIENELGEYGWSGSFRVESYQHTW